MRPVQDEDGRAYMLLKESDESSLVCDPETGEKQFVNSDSLTPIADTGPLDAAADGLPDAVRAVVRGVHDEQTLGLLVILADRGALSVRTLLDETTFCESDLHGRLAELVAAGLIAETTLVGERGYEPTPVTETAIELFRTN